MKRNNERPGTIRMLSGNRQMEEAFAYAQKEKQERMDAMPRTHRSMWFAQYRYLMADCINVTVTPCTLDPEFATMVVEAEPIGDTLPHNVLFRTYDNFETLGQIYFSLKSWIEALGTPVNLINGGQGNA